MGHFLGFAFLEREKLLPESKGMTNNSLLAHERRNSEVKKGLTYAAQILTREEYFNDLYLSNYFEEKFDYFEVGAGEAAEAIVTVQGKKTFCAKFTEIDWQKTLQPEAVFSLKTDFLDDLTGKNKKEYA